MNSAAQRQRKTLTAIDDRAERIGAKWLSIKRAIDGGETYEQVSFQRSVADDLEALAMLLRDLARLHRHGGAR